ncbi:LytTR family transcriptional regulator [Xanthomonas campestris pv. campestris]|nr:LytTR family transcriptional regulator [Xanthomonas campestris pv. campestris]
MGMSTDPARTTLERFLPWQRSAGMFFWLLVVVVNASGNAVTELMDRRRAGLPIQSWEPWVWELSSGLVWLLMLVPVIGWFTRKLPLHLDTWWRRLPWYLLVSVAVSVVHVLTMVGLRMLAYRLLGEHYEFGAWPQELVYEYLKDVRTFAIIVACMHGYRFLLRRLQGEVRLLAAPDEGAPVESLERPGRFLVRKLGRDFLVAAADIEWLQASGNYVNLHVRGHDYPLRSTMTAIEAKLDPAVFVRIHRSYIVNLGCVVSIEPLDAGEARVHLSGNGPLPCSRRYLASLRRAAGHAEAPAVPVVPG